MEGNIYIPKKLKVGYNKRSDTYSKKLAYVTYYDDKGKLRKGASWAGWIEKDMGIDEFDNTPMEGFVLNRNVGGAKLSYGYDVRIEKVRVYDPRGFEIEIDIPNVLFILQECTSVKGKGLDGTFVYGWVGTKLTLVPTTCLEYKEAIEFTSLQGRSILPKDLIEGCVYKTKKRKDLVYLGRFDWVTGINSYASALKKTKKHVFVDLNPEKWYKEIESIDDYDDEEDYKEYLADCERERLEDLENGEEIEFLTLPNTNSLAMCVSDTPISNYAELLSRFNKTCNSALPVAFVEEKANMEIKIEKRNTWWDIKLKSEYFTKDNSSPNTYIRMALYFPDYDSSKKPKKLNLRGIQKIYFDTKGNIINQHIYKDDSKTFTLEELEKMEFYTLSVKLANNNLAKINSYI